MQAGEDGSPQSQQHDPSRSASSGIMLNGEGTSDPLDAVMASASGSSITSSAAHDRVPSRSPHPYHRSSISALEGTTTRIKPDLASRSRDDPLGESSRHGSSTSLAGAGSHVGLRARHARNSDSVGSTSERRRSGDISSAASGGRGSPNESGTEADDESMSCVKALPAPPMRPRKGLKNTSGSDETPLLTPTAIDEEGAKFDFPIVVKGKRDNADKGGSDQEMKEARARFVKRRRAELGRRASEVLLLALIGILCLGNGMFRLSIQRWHRAELLSHVTIISALYLIYPLRLIAYAWGRTKTWKPIQRTIRLPAAFDPAPLLYPQFVPVMIALILLPTYSKVLLPNLILGLASIPGGLYRFGNWDVEPLRWLVSMAPLIVSEHTDFPHRMFAIKPYLLKAEPEDRVEPEVLAALYPFHQSLVQFLQYLTSTSLLPAEVHLMSIGLINLLLCAEMPHTVILQILLWLGGLGTYILIGPVIRWNIALARVPRWRFKRAIGLIQMRQSFLATLNQALTRSRSVGQKRIVEESDADDDHKDDDPRPQRKSSIISLETIKKDLLGSLKTNLSSLNGVSETRSAIETSGSTQNKEKPNGTTQHTSSRPRRNTLPNAAAAPVAPLTTQSAKDRKRRAAINGTTLFGRSFSSITQREANVRKWAYSAYTYAILLLLIFGPIRNLIGRYALNGHEPFGWAFSYLFGYNVYLQKFVRENNLKWWIPLPSRPGLYVPDCILPSGVMLGRVECLRNGGIYADSMRILLCLWCIIIIILGLGVVLVFTFVEVDTRRKVFHGMMVAMLLPTIFIDPAFISLALIIILAIFLILDLIRASQLPPLSRPIAMFLTPYVDGRDLRGPVVVSHIFLLIGCAVPLWLSLAGSNFSGGEPWRNWEVDARDVSMISGVVCVGMGDAAASLIGRRYGRRKWPWTGGKSLEGSAAFAFAVTIGLMAAKVWLRFGGWMDLAEVTTTADTAASPPSSHGVGRGTATVMAVRGLPDYGYENWLGTLLKAGTAACGASFMEAVLTGGNDNVVVPVVLWILVKALRV